MLPRCFQVVICLLNLLAASCQWFSVLLSSLLFWSWFHTLMCCRISHWLPCAFIFDIWHNSLIRLEVVLVFVQCEVRIQLVQDGWFPQRRFLDDAFSTDLKLVSYILSTFNVIEYVSELSSLFRRSIFPPPVQCFHYISFITSDCKTW